MPPGPHPIRTPHTNALYERPEGLSSNRLSSRSCDTGSGAREASAAWAAISAAAGAKYGSCCHAFLAVIRDVSLNRFALAFIVLGGRRWAGSLVTIVWVEPHLGFARNIVSEGNRGDRRHLAGGLRPDPRHEGATRLCQPVRGRRGPAPCRQAPRHHRRRRRRSRQRRRWRRLACATLERRRGRRAVG